MSTSTPPPPAHDPNLYSHQPDPPDQRSSNVDLPPDPILQSGSFIDTNPRTPTTATSGSTTTNAQTLNKKSHKQANSNGAESAQASENTPQRRPPLATETLNWLPTGWLIEDRVRTSGATAGLIDRYYFDPTSGRRFRSKKEVLYFLETGTPRKKKRGSENSDAGVDLQSLGSSGSNKQKSSARSKIAALNFDYFNAPEKIQWVLTKTSEDSWTPFIGKDKVPEYIRRDWTAAFTSITTNNGGNTMS